VTSGPSTALDHLRPSSGRVDELREQLIAAGFRDVNLATVPAGRRTMAIISGTNPPAST
jgi:hypothetical protein